MVGSAYYNDSYNVEIQGGGWTKHSGPFQMALGNIWIAPVVGDTKYPWQVRVSRHTQPMTALLAA